MATLSKYITTAQLQHFELINELDKSSKLCSQLDPE